MWAVVALASTSLLTPPTATRRVRVSLCARGAADDATAKRALDVEFARIAVPALVQFAAEPVAGLVDTAYLGRLGATALGGAGVAISAHYATAKLFNDPLLRTSISIVASGDGAASGDNDGSRDQAISAALVLALLVGLLQMGFFLACAPSLVSTTGAPAGSPMRPVALSYLRVRALGVPAATLWLVANGIFRGLGDTRTPLAWALGFSALNAVLDPLFIFVFGLGAAGAAAGTALAQSAALVGLLRALSARTGVAVAPAALLAPAALRAAAPSLVAFGRAGVLVLVRTVGKVFAYTYCARAAAGLGTVASAAHLLCFNLGVVLSQLCESVAVATQTLLARSMGALRAATADTTGAASGTDEAAAAAAAAARRDAFHVMRRGALVGGGVACALTALTALRPAAVVGGLTTDAAVREACRGIVGPVLACQLFKGLAFPANGVVMGGLDWRFAAAGVWMGTALCLALVHTAAPPTLTSIWLGLSAFMASQTLLSAARVASRAGPWAILWAREGRGSASGSPRGEGAAASTTPTLLVVAAALVTCVGDEPKVLLAQRPPGKRLAGLWEFPGGKVESGETPEGALTRELKEELGIEVDSEALTPLTFASQPLAGATKDAHLLMPLFVCVDGWRGEPVGAEGQQVQWATAQQLGDYAMPPADLPMLPQLRTLLGAVGTRRSDGGD